MISPKKIEEIRSLFPSALQYLYLNHAGVCPTSTKVLKAMDEYMQDALLHGVAHEMGWEDRAEKVRGQFAQLVHCSPEEVTFVRNTSHGLSLFASGFPWQKGDNVVVAVDEEYPSNVYPWQQLSSKGVEIRPAKAAADHRLPIDHFAEAVDHRTRAIAVSSVQYGTGFRSDLAALGELAKNRGAYLIVDGIQSTGCLEVDVKRDGIHLLSADSHKWLLGFSGIGACYIDRELVAKLTPPLVGWKSTRGAWNFDEARYDLWEDARRFEEGSPNYASIYGLGATLEIFEEVGMKEIQRRIFELTDLLLEGLQKLGFPLVSSLKPEERSGIVSFTIPGVTSEEVMAAMEAEKVVLSFRRKAYRTSPHFYNTKEEMERFLSILVRWK